MTFVKNPILKGFNPDPSIIRVEDDYYIATSTFEWFPGVQIHHSKDLVNWKLISRPLNRISQLDMKGAPDSCGVWAPCLSYDNGVFYLVYSNVKSFSGKWKDTPNFLVTTTDISGDWSEPIFLDASGFDGSLFHDNNGSKWYTSLLVDHRKGKMFGGIILQEYSETLKKLIGPKHHIFEGSDLGLTEGPHIYQKDGYYYLITAEGGTEYGHAATIARSKSLIGPYEISPNGPLLTCRNEPNYYLQKSGHADLVQTKAGEWIIVFLTGRPLTPLGKCILGRETSIESIYWPKGEWPTLGSGSCIPRVEVPLGTSVEPGFEEVNEVYTFDAESLNIEFQSLRVPVSEDWLSLSKSKGKLCLYGRQSLNSTHEQSLIARRIQSYKMTASTNLQFNPESFQQMAGLVCYYNTSHYHYLNVSRNEAGQLCVQLTSHDLFEQSEALAEPLILDIEEGANIYLKVEMNGADLKFFYALEADKWFAIGEVLDATIISDDHVRDGGPSYMPAFTGAFVGLCCQDLEGHNRPAYFDYFTYKEEEFQFPSSIKKNLSCEISV